MNLRVLSATQTLQGELLQIGAPSWDSVDIMENKRQIVKLRHTEKTKVPFTRKSALTVWAQSRRHHRIAMENSVMRFDCCVKHTGFWNNHGYFCFVSNCHWCEVLCFSNCICLICVKWHCFPIWRTLYLDISQRS